MKIKKINIFEFLDFLVTDVEETDFWGLCAQMSFYLLMAFFPLIVFLINFISHFISQFENYLYEILESYLPELSYTYIYNLMHSGFVIEGSSHYYLLILSFFFASLAARAVMIGMNQNYGDTESRSHVKIWLLSFLFTFLFALSIIILVLVYIFTEHVGTFLFSYLKIDPNLLYGTKIFTLIFSTVVMILLLNCVYVLAPSRRQKLSRGLPGAIFSTLCINIIFRIFVFSINHSTKYTMLYGNLGGLFALLVGIYFICVILNLGGKINVFFYR